MESLVSPLGNKLSHQIPARKCTSGGSQKDLWSIAREGSLSEVDFALMILKKHGGNIDARNMLGLTPLHIATWRNNIPIVRKLLAAGADPDARDGESGWSSLHRALHFGHLAVASILLQSGGSLTLEDSKRRIPTDLLSGPVLQVNGSDCNAVLTEVFSWGSGANYQLGTGNAHIQKLPCRVDALQGLSVKFSSAAKFHSVAVGTRGELYTWGFGRGGRLGHPEFDIHSGQAAVITPRQVTCGLGSRRVKAIAAAKHHTVIATEGGEVFTWGSNREGQLGYTSVDSQPTPRRVSSLRTKVISVAAANKHTAVISESGEVFTWGCNKEGQLGYGTSNSASNYTPRVVEYLKGKNLIEIAAAKYHTIVLGADGEVFTWGHRLVIPRRVLIARNIKKGGDTQVKFHRMEKLHVVAVAAGMVHSLALTDDGSLFYWVSSDPGLRCRQLYSMCGRSLVSISAGKYWTAAASSTGDIYMWDGKKGQGEPPIATRLHGVKRATSVSVGETHLLIVCALYHPVYPPKLARSLEKLRVEIKDEFEELEEGFMFDDINDKKVLTTLQKEDDDKRPVPSLKSLCEQAAAESLVEPRNAIQLLEIADSMGADELRKHCENIAMRNLDYILTVSAQSIASASLEVLANLEKVMDAKSSESWSHRRLPTPTATFPAVINSEEEDIDTESPRVRDNNSNLVFKTYRDKRSGSFLQSKHGADQAVDKQIRALRKKLQQIEMLEAKQANGHPLDDQQIAKLQTRSALEISLTELGATVEKQDIPSSPALSDGKGSKKLVVTKKQKRKTRQKAEQAIRTPEIPEIVEPYPIKGFLDGEICQIPKEKDGDNNSEEIRGNPPALDDASLCKPMKDVRDGLNSKASSPAAPKRKNKKGGLSMFLSGALDDLPQKAAPPLVTPKNEGPAWGGAKILKGPASLRDIQDEENKTRKSQPSRKVNSQAEELIEGRNDGGIPLSSFLPIGHSSSIAVASSCTSLALEGEKNTPPWAAAGSSPISCKLSLRDIQMQQTKKNQQCLSHSPKTRTAGFSVTTGQGSPSDSSGPNRWFKPENNSASSIRSIQIEEKAMKDLKRFYSNVKLVRDQT
ncbi:E3 ubiquitin-protein ligase herc2 [Thalictrum thalictroides]|uniref:E3 ubiquitin-protein ligase herc2 n=1 Tax=Thalictrum thalictroides TaxID=46969 RepID=A0A7J6VI40_THATH|nr:E3 ubiquitin-protein ligase herc2 [Thalictrum thalictroides]